MEEIDFVECPDTPPGQALTMEFSYDEDGGLKFSFDLDGGAARLESSLPGGLNSVSSHVRLLPPEKALAEALFF